MNLTKYTDEQLLFELVRRNGLQKAPKRTEYFGDGWVVSTIGIGKDAAVSLTMDRDDLKDLAVLALLGGMK